MTPEETQFLRIARRIREATGYAELGMHQHALERLSDLGKLGPLEAEVALVRGEMLRQLGRIEEAEEAFLVAAAKFPSPQDRTAWLALSVLFRQVGDAAKAVSMLARARGAQLPEEHEHPV
jgi:tetratricopeptide (TPR) repeat protein